MQKKVTCDKCGCETFKTDMSIYTPVNFYLKMSTTGKEVIEEIAKVIIDEVNPKNFRHDDTIIECCKCGEIYDIGELEQELEERQDHGNY